MPKQYTPRPFPLSRATLGAVGWYPFSSLPPFPGEICKERQVVILDRGPIDGTRDVGYLRVAPLSTSETKDQPHLVTVVVKFNGTPQRAITNNVQTINPRKLVDFEGILPSFELKKIGDGFSKHILPSMELPPEVTVGPGDIFNLPWGYSARRSFVVIGNMELTKCNAPVYCLPLTSKDTVTEPEMKIRALAWQRLFEGKRVGRLDPVSLDKCRRSLLRSLGLQGVANG